MEIFLDTAQVASLKEARLTGLISGVTTNPTLLSKAGGDIGKTVQEICTIMHPFDVSIEVTEKDPEAVYKQAHQIASLAPNVVVKIPCVMMYTPIIQRLVEEGITINITLVFSLVQGLLMAKLGVKYVSPFVGRLDDIDTDGLQLIDELRQVYDIYRFDSKILAASIRSVSHIHHVALAGADVVTIPEKLFFSLLEHPLTEQGIARFDSDWKKLDIKKFP